MQINLRSSKRVNKFRNLQQISKNLNMMKLGKNALKGPCRKITAA